MCCLFYNNWSFSLFCRILICQLRDWPPIKHSQINYGMRASLCCRICLDQVIHLLLELWWRMRLFLHLIWWNSMLCLIAYHFISMHHMSKLIVICGPSCLRNNDVISLLIPSWLVILLLYYNESSWENNIRDMIATC